MSNIRITGDGPTITATGSGSTVLVEINTGQHDPGSFSGVHNDLTGRSTAGAHVGTAVSIDPSGFNGNLDGTIVNAQLLAAAVDDLTTGGGGGSGQVADFATITVDTVLTEPKHLIVGGSSPKVTLPDAATWTGQHMVIAANTAYTLTLPDDFGGYDYSKAAYSLTTCISNGGGWQVYNGVPISSGTEGQVLGWQSDVLTWITPAGGGSGDVVGPASAVDGKVVLFDGTTGKLVKDSGVTLGGAASLSVGSTAGTVAAGDDARLSDSRTPTAHNHAASEVTSGTIGTARLGSGSASSSTYLRGDQTWATPSGIADPGGSNDDFLQRKAGAWAARTVAQVKADLAFPILTTATAGQTYGMGGVVGSDSAYVNGLNKWWGGVTYLPAGSYDRVVFSVLATGTSTWSMGIYPLNPATGFVDAATAPIHNIGDVDLSLATGAISVTTSFTLAAPRLVWIGGSISAYTSAATIRTVGGTDAAVTRLEGAPLGGTIAGGVANGALATGIRVLSGSGTAGINNFPAGGEFAAAGPKIQVRAA